MKRRIASVIAVVGVLMSIVAVAQPAPANDTPADSLRLDQPYSGTLDLDRSLRDASGPVQLSIRLSEPAVARGGSPAAVAAEQAAVSADLEAMGATMLGSVSTVMNAVFVEVDAANLAAIRQLGAVSRVTKVADYELTLSETVPYIGGTAVQEELGFDGSGVTVAVLDSGIDYTHANLGGGGTVADFEAAWGTSIEDPANTTTDGLFPTAKVIDGFDFVGELWDRGNGFPLAPDPDPIDFEGHGTHVADIIAGTDGVAPGASLVAIKVCSATGSACSGIALIQGMEYAVNAEVDIINMSLGSRYGTAFDDDLSFAVDSASALGILTVASAGNSADKPYVAGTPANAPTALSVAQTQVPSAGLQLIDAETITGIAAVPQPWSPAPETAVSGTLQYGDGADNLLGCDPFAEGSLDGLVVLVDRGACNFTLKIANINAAGGVAGIIGLVAPGGPFSGGDGGDRPIDIPGYMISQIDSGALKARVGETVTIDPTNVLPLVGQMVGSSSRGPAMGSNLLKPEIGAPGASVSAVAGSGSGTGPFGGTSGAAPMVSGAAALLLEAEPDLTPAESKARLVQTGETDILTDPFSGLAPVSRIGGGEVRADSAVMAQSAAWDSDTMQATLSFGFVDAWRQVHVDRKMLTIYNYSDEPVRYDIEVGFRYEDDAERDAVRIWTPEKVWVAPNSSVEIPVNMRVRTEALDEWALDSGGAGADPVALTAMEYDGYVHLVDASDDTNSIHVPWHVLPRKSGHIGWVGRGGEGDDFDLEVINRGRGESTIESYSLIGRSPNLPEGAAGEASPTIDLRFAGYRSIPVPAGFCSGNESFLMQFAVATWERQQHSNAPASIEVQLDFDLDGEADFAIFNADLSLLFNGALNLSDGRNAVYALDLATDQFSVFFLTDHITNSGNTVMTVCAEQLGLTVEDAGAEFGVDVLSVDIYNDGLVDDVIGNTTGKVLGERWIGVFDKGGVLDTTLGAFNRDTLIAVDTDPAMTSERGLLLMYRGGAEQSQEARVFIP